MSQPQDPLAPRLAESTRVEAFSDGVFAIALTLLVLDLHAPDTEPGGFARALLDQWPAYLAYLAAFLNIGSIWINHHDLFTRVRRVDIRLMSVNLVLLLVASLFPWPAEVISAAVRVGNHEDQVAAILLYAGVGLLVPLAWTALYGYLARTPHLLTEPAAVAYTRDGLRRTRLSIVVYPVAGAVGVLSPVAALGAFSVVPLFFVVTLLASPARPHRSGIDS